MKLESESRIALYRQTWANYWLASLLACMVVGAGAAEPKLQILSRRVALYSNILPNTTKALAYNHAQLIRIMRNARHAVAWTPKSAEKRDGPLCQQTLTTLRQGQFGIPDPVAILDGDDQIDGYYTLVSGIARKYAPYAEASYQKELAGKPAKLDAQIKLFRETMERDFFDRDMYKEYSILSFLPSSPRASDDKEGNSPVPNLTRRFYENGPDSNGEPRYLQAVLFGDRRAPDRRFVGIALWGLSSDAVPGFSGDISASDRRANPYKYFGVYGIGERVFAWGLQPRPNSRSDVPVDFERDKWTWMLTLRSPWGTIGDTETYCIILLK